MSIKISSHKQAEADANHKAWLYWYGRTLEGFMSAVAGQRVAPFNVIDQKTGLPISDYVIPFAVDLISPSKES